MDRCPNCGAPLRTGAKFCTTCGFRLPESAPDSPPVVAALPRDTAEADTGEAKTTVDSPRTDEASDWPASAAAWPASWEARSEPDPAPAPAENQESPPSADVVPASEGTASEEPIPDADPTVTGLNDPVTASLNPASPVRLDVVGPAMADDPGAADALETARALVDELRNLLPVVAAGAESRPRPNVDAVAADLEAARRRPDDARAREFDALRAALEHARERPRDLDTLLDLVGRVDVVLALQEAHDRYAAAIDRAAATLRGDGERRTGGGR